MGGSGGLGSDWGGGPAGLIAYNIPRGPLVIPGGYHPHKTNHFEKAPVLNMYFPVVVKIDSKYTFFLPKLSKVLNN